MHELKGKVCGQWPESSAPAYSKVRSLVFTHHQQTTLPLAAKGCLSLYALLTSDDVCPSVYDIPLTSLRLRRQLTQRGAPEAVLVNAERGRVAQAAAGRAGLHLGRPGGAVEG